MLMYGWPIQTTTIFHLVPVFLAIVWSCENSSGDEVLASIDLDDEALQMAERDRTVEARIKFSVHGMHGALIHKTPNPRTGPKAKKLAEPRWKTLLPLQ